MHARKRTADGRFVSQIRRLPAIPVAYRSAVSILSHLNAAQISCSALSDAASVPLLPSAEPIVETPDEALGEGDLDFADAPSTCNSSGAEQWALYNRLHGLGNELSVPVHCDVLGLLRFAKDGLRFGRFVESLETDFNKVNIYLAHVCSELTT